MTSYEEIETRLFAHLRGMTDPDVDLDGDTDLVDTLGLDSTEVVDMVLDIEDQFDVLVPMNELTDVRTAGQLAKLVHRLVEEEG
ncbi:MAG TPA: acyl carrier protein [Longimicrobiales bacterium]|nr:acyl carrier protein [Longimicrobiales bacterium]